MKRFPCLFLLACLWFTSLQAQIAPTDNRLLFFADTARFDRLFRQIDSLQDGRPMNIVHIGGSHVQAGFFTKRMIHNLNAGPGLVFPFCLAKSNTPMTFRAYYTGNWGSCLCTKKNASEPLGLTGAAAFTTDTSATLTLVTKPRKDSLPVSFLFNRLTLLGYSDQDAMQPLLQAGDTVITGCFNPVNRSYLFEIPFYTDSVTLRFTPVSGRFTLTGLWPENDKPGITYHSFGVNGATLRAWSKCQNLERDLGMIHPDLAIFAVGINDAVSSKFAVDTFIKRYDSLITVFHRVNPDCPVLFITNNDSFRRVKRGVYRVNPNGVLARDAFVQLGAKYGGAVWDQFSIMGGLHSMKSWEKAGLAVRDKIHFTAAGYSLLADWFWEALMECYRHYRTHTNSTGKPIR